MTRFTTLRHMSSQPATETGTGLLGEVSLVECIACFFKFAQFFCFARGALKREEIIYTRKPGPDSDQYHRGRKEGWVAGFVVIEHMKELRLKVQFQIDLLVVSGDGGGSRGQ